MKDFNFKKIMIIFVHEIKYMLRDKTTLFMMILLPIIIYPLISVVSAYMFVKSADNVKKDVVNIVMSRDNKALTGSFKKYFDGQKLKYDLKYFIMETSEIQAGINGGDISVYIEVAEKLDEKLAAGETVAVYVKYDISREKSSFAASEAASAIREYRAAIVKSNIEKLNISENLIMPVEISNVNIASPSRVGDSFLARILPMAIIMFATLGAFYPAIDVTAMEKERGTLETLLLAPVGPLDIMFGKFLAVFSLTMLSIVINLASISLTLTHGFLIIKKLASVTRAMNLVNFSVSIYSIFVIFLFMVPMACIMSAIMMQVAIFARNFKEAQNYMTPILLIFMLPPMVSILPGYELTPAVSFLPIVNLTLLLKGMLNSNYSILCALITFSVNIAVSFLVLILAAKTFSSEAVLFRPSEDVEVLYFWRYRELKVNQELSIFIVFFMLQLVALYYVGSFVQTFFADLKTGLLITEILLILIPSYVFVKSVYGSFFSHIGFKLPPPDKLGYAALVAITGFGFTSVLTLLQSLVLNPPEEMLKAIQNVIVADTPANFIIVTFITALLPAVCEEVMFRGMALSVLLKKYAPINAAIICGVLFGLFHFSVYRFIPTAVIGFYLSLLKISTGSIIPPMLAHFINNFIVVLFSNLDPLLKNSVPPSLLVACECLLVFSFFIFPFIIKPMIFSEEKTPAPEEKPEASVEIL